MWVSRRLMRLNPSMSIETSEGALVAWAFLGMPPPHSLSI